MRTWRRFTGARAAWCAESEIKGGVTKEPGSAVLLKETLSWRKISRYR
jgi:hypothetical protein